MAKYVSATLALTSSSVCLTVTSVSRSAIFATLTEATCCMAKVHEADAAKVSELGMLICIPPKSRALLKYVVPVSEALTCGRPCERASRIF